MRLLCYDLARETGRENSGEANWIGVQAAAGAPPVAATDGILSARSHSAGEGTGGTKMT